MKAPKEYSMGNSHHDIFYRRFINDDVFQTTIEIPIQIISWIYPPSSFSQHQDYCIFRVANPKLLIIICYDCILGFGNVRSFQYLVPFLGGFSNCYRYPKTNSNFASENRHLTRNPSKERKEYSKPIIFQGLCTPRKTNMVHLKMNPWKKRFLLETIIFRFQASFLGGMWNFGRKSPEQKSRSGPTAGPFALNGRRLPPCSRQGWITCQGLKW